MKAQFDLKGKSYFLKKASAHGLGLEQGDQGSAGGEFGMAGGLKWDEAGTRNRCLTSRS